MPKTQSKQRWFVKPLVVIFTLFIQFLISAQDFSKTEVLSDLAYLKQSLEDTHINLYAYTSKEAFEKKYLEVKSQISAETYSLLEVINHYQKVVAMVNNAHTRIPFPVQAYLKYANSGGGIFPLEVSIENGIAFIRKNWSTNDDILIGDELLAINNRPIQEVFENIYPQISAERLYFKNAQLVAFTLPRYYWLVFGEKDEFQVQIKHKDSMYTHTLKAVKAMDGYEMKRDDILKPDSQFKHLSDDTAYLRPGKFGGEIENYRRFIDSAFGELTTKKVKNLIIDLRNNPGGDDAFGDYLVSYIADRPFKWSSNFKLKSSALLKENVRQTKDTTERYWRSVLTHKTGEIYRYDFGSYQPQPSYKRYKGSVYVLVNRQSYSQATVTAAQIQDYGFGKLVGEETAEFPNLYASIFSYQLPKTGITVDVSKGKIERVSGVDTQKGVVPDMIIKDNFTFDKDHILEEIHRKIRQKTKI